MPTQRECLTRAEDFDLMAEFTSSEVMRHSYLAQAAQWRKLAAESPTLSPSDRTHHLNVKKSQHDREQ